MRSTEYDAGFSRFRTNMRRVILSIFVSVDGFISGPNGELDWMPGNERPDKEIDSSIYEMLGEVDAILLGRKTYQLFLDFWPAATTLDDPVAERLNSIPKVVFSETLDRVEWGTWDNARLAVGTLAEEITQLKQQPGKHVVIFGGANFAQSCIKLNLIDEYRLYVAPILLGGGKPLFHGNEERLTLKLVDATAYPGGTVLLRYEPARTHG